MADNSQGPPPTSSQENYSLPLSQDAFQYLWEELLIEPIYEDIPLDSSHFNSTADSSNGISSETVPLEPLENTPAEFIPKTEVSSSSMSYTPSSLPACENWTGPYNFVVGFGPQQKDTKGVSWTYSKLKDKLYVGKDVPCPINFCADTLSDNVSVRAMALYGSPEHASEIVHRCINHSMEETNKSIFEAEHLVRCESKTAIYKVDRTTKRHSVVVPFDIPPAGQQYSTYIYKFACFGSCAGGPNRRPIMLVFSLEKDGKVVGRRKLDVKICACPGRDRKAEEQQLMPEKLPVPKKRKESKESGSKESISLADTLNFTKSIVLPPAKKVKSSHKNYTINVDNKDQYEYLVQMNKLYEICKTVNNLPQHVKKALAFPRRKHHEDEDSH